MNPYMCPDENRGAILVVDDDDSIRQLVKACLENAGYTVFAASDGEIGLAFFKQQQKQIALLLTDVLMPNMNGIDLADRILELDGMLPVIFMSGSACPDRGNGCLSKPFRTSELVAKVGTVLAALPSVRPLRANHALMS